MSAFFVPGGEPALRTTGPVNEALLSHELGFARSRTSGGAFQVHEQAGDLLALVFALVVKDFHYSEVLFDATLLRLLDANFELITSITDSVDRAHADREASPQLLRYRGPQAKHRSAGQDLAL